MNFRTPQRWSDQAVRHGYTIRLRLLGLRNPNMTGKQWVDLMAELRWELQLLRDDIMRRNLTIPATKFVRVKKKVKGRTIIKFPHREPRVSSLDILFRKMGIENTNHPLPVRVNRESGTSPGDRAAPMAPTPSVG